MRDDEPTPPAAVVLAEEDTPVRRRGRVADLDAPDRVEKTVGVDTKTQPHAMEPTTMLPASHRGDVPREAVPRELTAKLDPPTRVLEAAEQLLCRNSVHADDPDTDDEQLFDRTLDVFEKLVDAVNARRRTARTYANEFEAQARRYDALADQANGRGDASGSAQWAARADELRAQARRIRRENP
jgi:hypothetical protein